MVQPFLKAAMVAVCVLALAPAASAQPMASYPSISVTTLADSAGTFTTYGGLMLDGQTLHFGNYDRIRTYDLDAASAGEYAVVGANPNIGTLNKLGGSYYASIDLDNSYTTPSNFGQVDPVNGFVPSLVSGPAHGEATYTIYDSAVHGGELYLVANGGSYVDDGSGGMTNQQNGTNIYRYETTNPDSPTLVASIGGYSGGLAFDTAGNLYYASQNAGQGVLKFDAADVQAGGLTAADGQTVLDITASSIGFLSDGTFLAETGWGATFSAYDLAAGEKLYDIATVDWTQFMGKFVVGDDDTIYLLSTNWKDSDSVLSAVTVPEPTALALLGLGGLAAWTRRRK